MDAFTIFTLFFWLAFYIIFGPLMYFICVYLPELPVRYIKSLRRDDFMTSY
ncbi:uncharacterized protein LOC119613232 isoform X10 [Lucilia sericata]|uniref:uncharacterized protein LOC119613232 isoform X10 n=1 Tax=Lucilia sericata TaxID=13632 RepID=UPI000C7193C6|nr:uncharacterized protein LOC119613232 isoform X10 [Lucilia sericata]